MIRRLLLALALMLGAVVPASAQNYTAMVTTTPAGSFVMGNPKAKVRLVEYLSYTCSHCAHFTEEAAVPLKRDYVAKGLVSVELRNLVRDPFDLTAALIARCGGPSRVFSLTEAIMSRQAVWMADAQVLVAKQGEALQAMKLVPQLQMIAKESGLLAIAQSKGVTPAQANACLAAPQMHKTVIAMTKDAVDVRKINSTPTFLINNKPGPKSSEWADMDTALRTTLGLR